MTMTLTNIQRPIGKLSDRTNDILFAIVLGIVLTAFSYLLALGLGWVHEVNPLEAFAVFTSYGSTYLCVVQRRFNYVFGAISTAAYCILFFQYGLLGSAGLNGFLAFWLVYGWIRWRNDADTRPVQHVTLKAAPIYLAVAAGGYGIALWIVTILGGHLALFDVAIVAGTILAQTLLDNKKIETWYIWAIVNVLAIYVYFSTGLYAVGIQYVLFLANTVWAFVEWRNSMKAKPLLGVVTPTPAQGHWPSDVPYHDEDWNFPDVQINPKFDNSLVMRATPATHVVQDEMMSDRLTVTSEQPSLKQLSGEYLGEKRDLKFKPGGTLYLTSGHLPKITEKGAGFWRRIKPVKDKTNA